ncbi:helix-turn-helix domain-containing protein [Flavobacterium gelatinilyticum]|uniref:helix-turn-helix domain-containing protein n=1 Tax=Flavobacterium gelatinilyticum TaxID=3003260 RepID=UPI00248190B1|nr:AraC family transcriptional regulator [Flavobacterium gelatinilyticum]
MRNLQVDKVRTDQTIYIDLNADYQYIKNDIWEISNETGEAFFKKFIFKNIHLCFGELKLNKNKNLQFSFSNPIIKMHFSLDGSSIIRDSVTGNELKFVSNQHNLIYYSNSGYAIASDDELSKTSSFHILFTEEHFLTILSANYPALDSFHEDIKNDRYSVLNPKNMIITPEMNSILNELIHCKRKGMLKTLFTEAKILKLLMLQFEQFECTQSVIKEISLKNYDIEKIHLAKSILEENISISLSLVELSHRAGLNDFKLKKGFKEVFGTTVFTYLYEIRMNEAKRLIIEDEKSLAEISLLCGYKFVQNFTKAFKAKFGAAPKEFRKNYL